MHDVTKKPSQLLLVTINMLAQFSVQVEVDRYGQIDRHELLPGGSSIPVTSENRKQYVELYSDWTLNTSIETQFVAFARGFYQVDAKYSIAVGRMV